MNKQQQTAKNEPSTSTMNRIEIDMVDMMMDMMRFAMTRISSHEPALGAPKTEAELRSLVGDTITESGIGGEYAFSLFKEHLLPATVATDHPRFLSFVPSAPSRASVLFDLVTSAVSIHGASWMAGAGGIFCENEAMKWIVGLTKFPAGSFGVFTSGGTAANLSALVTARESWREDNPEYAKVRPILMVADSAHSSNKSMARVIDCDLLIVGVDEQDRMTGETLKTAFDKLDEEDKNRVFCVVATAGTTNAGIIDELDSIGQWCNAQNIWMHIDGAYGGGAMASPTYRPLFNGTRLANSLTVDPHKWMFTPYDCGAVIYRDMAKAKRAHTQKAPYLDILEDDFADGFNPSDYQIQLSRRLRGLPLWFSLAMNGTQVYADEVDYAIDLAKYAQQQINDLPHVEMVRPRGLSIVIFRRIGWDEKQYFDWSTDLQRQGKALVMPTRWGNETVTRFCFINGNTTKQDVDEILASMID